MLTYNMEDRGSLPLYEYLYRRLRDDILSGKLAAGERLPSKRALAEHLRLSVVTVDGAYQQLEAEGYVDARPRLGFFVSPVHRRLPAAERPEVVPLPAETAAAAWRLDLTSGRVDPSCFPSALWARLPEAWALPWRTCCPAMPFMFPAPWSSRPSWLSWRRFYTGHWGRRD